MYFTTIEYITNNYIMYILQGAVECREGDHHCRQRRCAGMVVSVAVAGGVGIVVGRRWGWGGRIVTVDAGDGDRRLLSTALMVWWWWSSSLVAMSTTLVVVVDVVALVVAIDAGGGVVVEGGGGRGSSEVVNTSRKCW